MPLNAIPAWRPVTPSDLRAAVLSANCNHRTPNIRYSCKFLPRRLSQSGLPSGLRRSTMPYAQQVHHSGHDAILLPASSFSGSASPPYLVGGVVVLSRCLLNCL